MGLNLSMSPLLILISWNLLAIGVGILLYLASRTYIGPLFAKCFKVKDDTARLNLIDPAGMREFTYQHPPVSTLERGESGVPVCLEVDRHREDVGDDGREEGITVVVVKNE